MEQNDVLCALLSVHAVFLDPVGGELPELVEGLVARRERLVLRVAERRVEVELVQRQRQRRGRRLSGRRRVQAGQGGERRRLEAEVSGVEDAELGLALLTQFLEQEPERE